MKLTQITFHKEYKKGLANFSNITAGMTMTFDVAESEEISFPAIWERINEEIVAQANIDPLWINEEKIKKQQQFIARKTVAQQNNK